MFLSQHLSVIGSSNISDTIIEVERSVIGHILNWTRMIGTGIALIMLTYMAFRYLNTAPIHRKEVKDQLGNFAIGAFVFIGASNILYYAEQLAEAILNGVI